MISCKGYSIIPRSLWSFSLDKNIEKTQVEDSLRLATISLRVR